jgi:hypothetical protein
MCDAGGWEGAFEEPWGPLVRSHLDAYDFFDWSNVLLVCRSWGRHIKPNPRLLFFEDVSDETADGAPNTHGLRTLPVGLRELRLTGASISDWGFLGRLTNLTTLRLDVDKDVRASARITDDVVRRLCDMPNLRGLTALFLKGAWDATDASARCIATSMPGLVSLCVQGWRITDVGLRHICRLRHLVELDISDALTGGREAFSPEGCRRLLDLPNLWYLYVGESMEAGVLFDSARLLGELRSRGVEVVWF